MNLPLETVSARRHRQRRRGATLRCLREAGLGLGLSLSVGLAGAESLWESTFSGLIAGQSLLRVGDLVTSEVDSGASFDSEATAEDKKTLSLSLSGELFSFLPSGGSRGGLSTGGPQSYAVQAGVGARVIDSDAVGNAPVEGTRSGILSGRQGSIGVSGWLDPGSLASGAGQRAMFAQLTDGVVPVTGFLAPYAPILSSDDLMAAAGQGEVGADSQPNLALSEERRRQLLLQHLNRVIDLIFQ